MDRAWFGQGKLLSSPGDPPFPHFLPVLRSHRLMEELAILQRAHHAVRLLLQIARLGYLFVDVVVPDKHNSLYCGPLLSMGSVLWSPAEHGFCAVVPCRAWGLCCGPLLSMGAVLWSPVEHGVCAVVPCQA